MKVLMLVIVCAALALAGCGDDSDATTNAAGSAGTTTEKTDSEDRTTSNPDSGADAKGPPELVPKKEKPVVEVPSDPAPTELVVNDIEEGDGEEVGDKDTIFVDYVAFRYDEGKEFETTWAGKAPTKFPMDDGVLIEGWEQGIEGMKVGGRRELIVPSRLGYENGPLLYVVDLRGIE